MTKIYAGASEAVEAECSYRSDMAFTILEMYDNEPIGTVGYDNKAAMLSALEEYKVYGVIITILGE